MFITLKTHHTARAFFSLTLMLVSDFQPRDNMKSLWVGWMMCDHLFPNHTLTISTTTPPLTSCFMWKVWYVHSSLPDCFKKTSCQAEIYLHSSSGPICVWCVAHMNINKTLKEAVRDFYPIHFLSNSVNCSSWSSSCLFTVCRCWLYVITDDCELK